MIEKFVKRLFSGKDSAKTEPKVVSSAHYNNFEIRAAPVKDSNGWRVTGTVVKEIDGTLKEHYFIRADSCPDIESAAALTLRKARQLIDEQGDRIFD